LRYAWEIDNYFTNPVFKTFFRPAFTYLRQWDFKAAQRPDVLLAVSDFIARKISRFYGRTAGVVYPPVDYQRFHFDPRLQPSASKPYYYLAAGRLMHYKKFALLVESFLELRLNLLVVGTGPEMPKLRKMAAGSKNIRFVNFVDDSELHRLYSGAKALLFPQVEDFGLVAAEAQACGTPVLAYSQGGALEIVQDGKTGVLFGEQSVRSVVEAVRKFERMEFDRSEVSRLCRNFTLERFQEGIVQAIPPQIRRGIQLRSGIGEQGSTGKKI